MELKIKILHEIVKEQGIKYATHGSAGIDLRAAIDENINVSAGETAIIPCGFCIQMEHGYEAQIRSRSGMSISGLIVLNAPGTIDSDYRGEIKVILHNVSKNSFVVEKGMRIAQMIIAQYCRADIKYVNELGDTERSCGGFGSTGKF